MIVADAGPIIAFARIGKLDLLRQVVGELLIPDAVHGDLVTKGSGKVGAQDVEREAWIRRKGVRGGGALAPLTQTLGQGEYEAILLAQEENAQLLVDDRKARVEAQQRGIQVRGTLWVLGEAKRRGFIPAVRPLVAELRAIGYWMHEERMVRPFLRQMGEEPA